MKNCRLCSQDLLSKPLLRYENMPSVAQNFPDAKQVSVDKGVDLEIMQCSGCGLVQLNTEPVPYYRDVIRAAGYSTEMGEFRRKQFSDFLSKYNLKGKKVFEAGCGRGEYAGLMKECGGHVFGIEHMPSSVAECVKNGLAVTQGYIENEAYKIPQAPFDAFFILNFLEHIPNLNSYLKGIANNLAEGAVGLVEVPNFDMILRENMFCEFMTDHLYYFTKDTLRTALNLNGFDVLECHDVWHDYIISAVVKKRSAIDLSYFSGYKEGLRVNLQEYVGQFESQSVAIWGAGHQALAVMSLAKLDGLIKYVLDSAPFKQNKFTPATHIPIVDPSRIEKDLAIKAVIVMGASYSDEIVRILKAKYRPDLSIAVLRSGGLEVVKP